MVFIWHHYNINCGASSKCKPLVSSSHTWISVQLRICSYCVAISSAISRKQTGEVTESKRELCSGRKLIHFNHSWDKPCPVHHRWVDFTDFEWWTLLVLLKFLKLYLRIASRRLHWSWIIIQQADVFFVFYCTFFSYKYYFTYYICKYGEYVFLMFFLIFE